MASSDYINNCFCIEARWVLPVHPNPQNVLDDTAIVVEDSAIKDILPISEAIHKYPEPQFPRTKLNTHVVLPGFINTHSHSPMTLLRGIADDLPLMQWLTQHIWPIENHILSEESVFDGAILAIAEMLHNGITCFNEMYFYSNSIAHAADVTGIRANIGTHVFDQPSKWADGTDSYLLHCKNLDEQYKQNKLINSIVCPHSPYTVSDTGFKKIIDFSEKFNISIGCHLHETVDEINHSIKQYKVRPLERLNKLGILDSNFHAIHVVDLTDEEIALISRKKIDIAHCPRSNLKLASGICRVRDLLNSGINVALGTDGAASCNDLDILGELRTASLLAKGQSKDPTAMPDYKALELATLNGAKLMGLDSHTGSLSIGKDADIIAIDLSHYSNHPVYNPISSIVYTATKQQISDVWVNGRQKVANHKLLNLGYINNQKIDHEYIKSIIYKWQNVISKYYSKDRNQ